MSEPRLVVVAGAKRRSSKSRSSPAQDELVKRWRLGAADSTTACDPAESRDVIPLLDGWIRRLEREAGGGSAQSH